MKVGVHLPQWGAGATRKGVIEAAQAAESAGFDSLWVADHIVFPMESTSRYPYRADGVPFSPDDGFLEAFTTLAVAAGVTSRVELGTSVLVMPMREPLITAKVVSTLDVLSGGRTVLAMGAGWWQEEFEALGQRFDARGRRFDEQIDILRDAWSHQSVSHDGEFYQFEELSCTPLPIQTGGPKLLIGGMGALAHRRAATLGDGWHAVGADLEVLLAGRKAIDKIAADNGRDPSEIQISTSAGLSSDPGRAADRVRSLAKGGVDHLIVNLRGEGVALLEEIEATAGAVLSAAGA